MRISVLAGLLLLGAVLGAQRPAPKTAADLEKLGPQVGQAVPGFSLPDQNGTTRTLKSLLGPNGALLVFFRSAEW